MVEPIFRIIFMRRSISIPFTTENAQTAHGETHAKYACNHGRYKFNPAGPSVAANAAGGDSRYEGKPAHGEAPAKCARNHGRYETKAHCAARGSIRPCTGRTTDSSLTKISALRRSGTLGGFPISLRFAVNRDGPFSKTLHAQPG